MNHAATAENTRGRSRTIRRVLLVDDDPSVLQSFAPVLTSMGLDVTTALGREEACRTLDALRIDLVITDLRLRGKEDTDGLDLLSWVRDRHAETVVVVMTGLGSFEIRKEAMKRGAADYWEKSMPVGEMVLRLRELGAA